ncbi:PH domain-containing protein [Leucobacter komagatae]|uniref:PH domain-containing protein n=1 Tax=Leucobacter komagatae TaxID=55969 RepID=UPI000A9596C6|nr:PH domain-containing protein [Leucobacter komagatae]
MTSHELPGDAPRSPNVAPVEPAGAEQMPGTADADGWRRLHPVSPLLRGGLVLVVVIGIVIANFRDVIVRMFFSPSDGDPLDGDEVAQLFGMLSNRQTLLLVVGGVLVLLLVIVGVSWVAWRFHTYRVTADAVESRSGVVFRQHRRAPLDRVQSVNLQRPLLARVLGLTKIEVLTGGQGGKVELAYLGHRDAKAVRERILHLATARRNGEDVSAAAAGVFAEAAVSLDGSLYAPPSDALTQRAQDFADFDVDPVAAVAQSLVRVPVGRLLGSIVLGWESVITILLLLLAVFWGVVSAAIGTLTGRAGFVAAGGISLITVIPLILVLLGMMFAQFNKGFNFTLSRGRESVRVGSGLTSTVTDSIPFGRIHAIEARQPLLWRPFGWWRVRVTLAGHSVSEAGQSVTQNVVLPVGKQVDVVRVMETLVPGAATGINEGLTGAGDGYVRAGARSGWLLLLGKRRAGIRIDVPSATTSPQQDVQAIEPAPTDATLRIRRGALTRSLAIMPLVRAQSVQLSRPLGHYLLGLATLQAHTVLGPVRMLVRGISLAEAQRVFAELAEAVLVVQRAESDTHQATKRGEAHE